MPVDPGKLRHKMTIEQPAQSRNEAQEVVESWSEFKSAYFRIQPQSMSETQRGGASGPIGADATHLISGWHIDGLTPDMRLVKSDGRIFEIVSILTDDEAGEETQILAREAVNA